MADTPNEQSGDASLRETFDCYLDEIVHLSANPDDRCDRDPRRPPRLALHVVVVRKPPP